MSGISGPSEAPEVIAPTREGRIEQLQQAIPQLQVKADATLQRVLMGRELPKQVADGSGAQWESFTGNYGKMIENKVELYLLSGVPEQLNNDFDTLNPPFASKAVNSKIEEILDLFEIKQKSNGDEYSNLMGKFGQPNNRMTMVKSGFLNEKIVELQEIDAVTSNPEQKAYLQRLIGALQDVINLDVLAKKDLEKNKNYKHSKLGKLGQYARLIAGAVAVGLAIFSLMANKGKPNLATALYLGGAYLAFMGPPKGKLETERAQIEFLGSAGFEKFANKHSIQGVAWADFTDELAQKDIGNMTKDLEKALKTTSGPDEEARLKEEFLQDIVGGGSDSAVHNAFRRMEHDERMKLIYWAQSVKSKDAKEGMYDFIRYRVDPIPES